MRVCLRFQDCDARVSSGLLIDGNEPGLLQGLQTACLGVAVDTQLLQPGIPERDRVGFLDASQIPERKTDMQTFAGQFRRGFQPQQRYGAFQKRLIVPFPFRRFENSILASGREPIAIQVKTHLRYQGFLPLHS